LFSLSAQSLDMGRLEKFTPAPSGEASVLAMDQILSFVAAINPVILLVVSGRTLQQVDV
jgi:hypothetical protein